MARDLSVFSDCGVYFAYSGLDGKLKLWDTVSGLLKQEYVPNLHLNTPCTTMTWISVSSSFFSPKKTKKRKVEEKDNKLLALGAADGSISLYSIAEGKVITTLKGGHSVTVSSLGWSKSKGLFSSAKNEVVNWSLSDKSVLSKWKCGKGKISCMAVSADGELCITGSLMLYLWNVSNRELLRTYTGHSSEICNIVFINSHYFLSCASEDRQISVWSTKGDYDEPLGRFATGDTLRSNISIFENNGTVHLCTSTRNGVLQFFSHQLNGKVGKVIKPQRTIEICTDENKTSPLPVICVKMSAESTATIVYGHPPVFTFEPITLTDSKKSRTTLIRAGKESNKSSVNNKATNEANDQAEYVSSGVRRKAGGDSVAMEDRLGNLSLGNPIISDKHSPYNLSNLLSQGLESKDRNLLENVLFRKDPQVIKETISKLPVSALVPLLTQLNSMIQGKTLSSMVGCMWLKGVLRQHSGQLLASSNTSSLLASLQALIESRLAVLGPLRGLSGRLEHIMSQLDSAQDQSLMNQQPVLLYQDEESSDDGESLQLEGEGSESEDKWEELASDGMDTDGDAT